MATKTDRDSVLLIDTVLSHGFQHYDSLTPEGRIALDSLFTNLATNLAQQNAVVMPKVKGKRGRKPKVEVERNLRNINSATLVADTRS